MDEEEVRLFSVSRGVEDVESSGPRIELGVIRLDDRR